MTLAIPAMTINGLEEQLIRDNVANPESQLGVRALAQLSQPYKQATLQRAESAYQAAYAANSAAELPNYLDKNAVIQWYVTSPTYKTATQRENAVRVDVINREINELNREKTSQEAKLATLTGENNAQMAESVALMITALESKITTLETEKVSLE